MLPSKLGTSLPLQEGVFRTAEQGPSQTQFSVVSWVLMKNLKV